MSRYISVETLSYFHTDGNYYPIKDIREILSEPIGFKLDIKKGDLLDEVANRKDVYGEMGEIQSYRIFDANIIELTEANFNLDNIKRLKIPI